MSIKKNAICCRTSCNRQVRIGIVFGTIQQTRLLMDTDLKSGTALDKAWGHASNADPESFISGGTPK